MSEKKYKRGAQLKTLDRFWNCDQELYVVKFFQGYERDEETGLYNNKKPIYKDKTLCKGWLISMQFRYLAMLIKDGRVYTARKIKENEQ